MTTTTPTPALADLPDHRLDYIARQYFADDQYQQYVKHAISDAFQEARRAAQPVAPVQASPIDPHADISVPGWDYPTTYADIARIPPEKLWNRYTSGKPWPNAKDAFLMARALPFVTQMAVPAPVTPSPQIAEVAELPPLPKPIGIVEYAVPGDQTMHLADAYSAEQYRQGQRDAIAASRRAAGGEPVAYVNGDELDNMLDDRTASIQGERSGYRATALYRHPAPASAGQAEKVCGAFECKAGQRDGVTCAEGECDIDSGVRTLSASAGQAAPAEQKEIVELIVAVMDQFGFMDGANEHRTEELREALESALAAQPAEGAGQAGQVAKPELMRQAVASVVSYGNGEFRVGWLRPERVEVGTLLYCATERAAAPAELTAAARDVDWTAANDRARELHCTNKPSAQKGGEA